MEMPDRVYVAQDVKELLERGAQLVDVLPAEDYNRDHLPGAINIPLTQLDARTTAGLDKRRPVIVYCNDFA